METNTANVTRMRRIDLEPLLPDLAAHLTEPSSPAPTVNTETTIPSPGRSTPLLERRMAHGGSILRHVSFVNEAGDVHDGEESPGEGPCRQNIGALGIVPRTGNA